MKQHCARCDRPFVDDAALKQHIRDSPTHAFDCTTCARPFVSDTALQQHVRDSPTHQQAVETPLDVFFYSFRSFKYEPSLSPATSYRKLQALQDWRRGDAASENAWCRYQNALQGELQMWCGAEDNITACHALCRAIGIGDPLPVTCEQ